MKYTLSQLLESAEMERFLAWGLKHFPLNTKYQRDENGILISLEIDML